MDYSLLLAIEETNIRESILELTNDEFITQLQENLSLRESDIFTNTS
jgi:hypothetical protein